jgi:hypothetical protein
LKVCANACGEPQAAETLDHIEKAMNKAVEHLTEAESKNAVPP